MRSQEFLATLSLILFYTSLPLLIPLGYAYYYGESSFEPILYVITIMIIPSVPVFIPGIFKSVLSFFTSIFNFIFRKEAHWNYALEVFTKRPQLSELKFGDILAISAVSWILIPLITSYPYFVLGMSPIDSFFESMSGWTSTGLSVITSFDNITNSVIIFRSVTQWVGGLGIILLMLSFLRNRQGKSLLAFEAKNPMELGAKNTASKIWQIYIVLTIISISLLYLVGFDLFNSVNLGLAGISNGGFFPFVTYDLIWIQKLVLAFTMFIGAISFVTHNKIFSRHLSVLLSQEFLLYVSLIIIGVALITFLGHDEFHNTLLNTVSAIACGGFAIGDLSVLHEFSIYVLVILMVCGGMYGSTTGGIKLWRILVALKVIWSRIRAYFVPSGTVQIITLDKNPVSQEAITEVLGFIFLYLAIFLICAGVFMAWDFGIVDSMFTVASALGNVGLSTIDIYALPDYSKAFLVFMMYIGRIEILPVLAMIRFMFGRK